MSNYPRNFPNLNHQNWSARTPDRRAEIDYPVKADPESIWDVLIFCFLILFSVFGFLPLIWFFMK